MALRMITAGESHGPGLSCIIEGMPAGLTLDREALNRDLARRQLGHGRGGRIGACSDGLAGWDFDAERLGHVRGQTTENRRQMRML